MSSYSLEFIELAIEYQALRFGQFTLKSGRNSPYFYNAGQFNTGTALAKLGKLYAQAIIAAHLEFDVLFGPAYKGIPLVCAVAMAFYQDYQRDVPFCFDRKEIKDHGEGGLLVGAPLQGRVLIIDDVITAGTAIRHSLQHVDGNTSTLAGVALSFNRQERGQTALSAVQEIEQRYQVPVISIATLNDIIDYLQPQEHAAEKLRQIREYQLEYGVNHTD
ncbi:MAG: orotate phosphoribosyltransferase [Legionellales bacterium]|nr:orotate phosphoribosyltransferase [Legionellales bacterium]